ADQRAFLGVPRFLDVASNLGFLAVGLLGLRLILCRDRTDATRFLDKRERLPYILLFAGVTLTCFGSIYYHLHPDNLRLAWDRLPMAIGFTAFVAAMIAERIDVRAGARLLLPLVLLGMGSVWYWQWSMARGAENLLPYLIVQGWSLLAALLMLAMFPPRYSHGRLIVLGFALYAAALAAEYLDRTIFSVGGILSGHTLKHLLAASAVYQLYRMLRDRRPV
ncbi:MAG TPA: hypothetical protein VMP00_08570, partial [Burkholderiales bacterium]|nr:hypothetical protein [Burkholderiales bacterium]